MAKGWVCWCCWVGGVKIGFAALCRACEKWAAGVPIAGEGWVKGKGASRSMCSMPGLSVRKRWRAVWRGLLFSESELPPWVAGGMSSSMFSSSALSPSFAFSISDVSLSDSGSSTPEKSAQTQPRGLSRRISPHSWRSFMPLPARNMMRVGV